MLNKRSSRPLFGTHESAFQRFLYLMVGLCHSNLGTIYYYECKVYWQREVESGSWLTDRTLYWMFPTLSTVISINATYLYGKYIDNLLNEVANIDDNKKKRSLCFAFLVSKNVAIWTWFLEQLHQYVTKHQCLVCIIFDHHGAINVLLVRFS